MSTKAFRYFKKGIQIQGETSDQADNAEGSVFVTAPSLPGSITGSRIKAYIEAAVRELVTNDQTQLLKNKSLEDSTTAIVDTADVTKKIKFDVGGSTATTTTISSAPTVNRVVTLPDNSSELVDLNFAQTLQNKSLVDANVSVVDSTDATKKIKFDAAGSTATSTTLTSSQTANRVLTLPDTTDTLVGKATTDTLTNKTLSDSTTSIVDVTDGTKKLVFDVQGTTGKTTTVVSASTDNRTITLPDSTDTLLGASTAASLSNKSLVDATTAVVDSVDATKKIKFDANGTSGTSTTLASSQTVDRTITFPDVTGTVVTTGDTGTVTATMIADGTIMNAEINASAAIARSKLASGTNNALQANSASGVLSDVSDITVGTNNFTLANTKHIEAQASTDSTTTGTSASLAAFTASAVRLTNIGLTSIANIPAGNNGQILTLFNRTGNDITVIDSSAASGTAADRIFTGTSGNITWKKDAAFLLQYDSTSSRWQIIGGTGSGGGTGADVDTFAVQDFENAALTDFTQTGLVLSTANPIKGTKSALLTHGASTQSFKQIIPVDTKFRGKNLTAQVTLRSTALSANVTITVTDETNATVLTTSPLTTGQITGAFFSTNNGSNLVGVSNLSTLNSISIGASITGSGIPANTIITGKSSSGVQISNNATATAASVTLKVSILPANLSTSFSVPTNCASISYTFSALAETGSPETYIDDIQLKLSTAMKTSASITQTTFNATDWTSYTPTFTGFGTPSAVEFEWRQVGANYEIRGKFVTGTVTATEARVSLPNGVSTAGTSVIPSIQAVGFGNRSLNIAGPLVLAQPSVTYLNFANSQAASSIAAMTANNVFGNNETTSFFASVPISGLSANTTTTTTIPLASSVLVTQPDSQMTWQGLAGAGSTRTKVIYFTNARSMTGSAISYTSSATNGLEVTVLEDGYYDISLTGTGSISSNTIWGIGLNVTDFTTVMSSRQTDITILKVTYGANTSTTRDSNIASWSGPLKAGDKLYPMSDYSTVDLNQTVYFSVSKVGSTKIINPSSDQKVTIPTHQLRFEGASSRGSTNTAIVKFDTQAITSGDAWTVNPSGDPSVYGTHIQIKKAGILTVNTTLDVSTTTGLFITKNQVTLTTTPITSEIMSAMTNIDVGVCSATFPVAINDIIRVCAPGGAPSASTTYNFLNLSLQEQSVAVALQNVTPQWDTSDSAIRADTGAGFGSTNTLVRRYSSAIDNTGGDITYTASSTAGDSFTINTNGIYAISCSDDSNAGVALCITKNQINTTAGSGILANSSGSAQWITVSTQAYLVKGDVIRVVVNTPANIASASVNAKFSISRVGKTSGTVDVTPFVNVPTIDVEAIEGGSSSSTWGSTNTGVAVLTVSKNSNKGIIQYISDSVNGSYFKILKDCELKINVSSAVGSVANNFFITRNATTLTVATPDGIIARTYIEASTWKATSASINAIAGDIIRFQRGSVTTFSVDNFTITATAQSSSVATPTQNVSSDTMNFVFQSTALTGNEAVGTFNTYSYATNSNTATINTSPPSQLTSDMNVNGIKITARPYNTNSNSSTSIARFDIFIGKGLKSKQVDAYASAGKVGKISYDVFLVSTNTWGTQTAYDEVTGILTITAGIQANASNTAAFVGLRSDNAASPSDGYFVFNAAKTPALTSIPNLAPRVAYLSEQQTSGTNGGASTATTWTTRVLNTSVDSTGIITSLASNQFTLPAGTYKITGFSVLYRTNNSKIRLRNITAGTTAISGSSIGGETNSGNVNCFLDGEVIINQSTVFALQYYASAAVATYGLGNAMSSGDVEVYSQLAITKIK